MRHDVSGEVEDNDDGPSRDLSKTTWETLFAHSWCSARQQTGHLVAQLVELTGSEWRSSAPGKITALSGSSWHSWQFSGSAARNTCHISSNLRQCSGTEFLTAKGPLRLSRDHVTPICGSSISEPGMSKKFCVFLLAPTGTTGFRLYSESRSTILPPLPPSDCHSTKQTLDGWRSWSGMYTKDVPPTARVAVGKVLACLCLARTSKLEAIAFAHKIASWDFRVSMVDGRDDEDDDASQPLLTSSDHRTLDWMHCFIDSFYKLYSS